MSEADATPKPVATLRIGQLALTGASAVFVMLAALVAIIIAIVYARPSLSNWPMWISAAIWLVFISYWSSAARGAATMTTRESVESRRVHERMLNGGLLLLFVPLPFLAERLVPRSLPLTIIGLAVQLMLFGLAIWARRTLGRNWSGAIGTFEGHRLVRSGPYRRLRHPIYTAMLGMAAGTTLVSMTPHAVAGFLLIAFAYARKVRLEEAHLRSVFGDEYDGYRRESWALIPYVL